jgi:broad specificity phosphatase PhoE
MKIILVRHGKPASAKNYYMTAAGFSRWARAYDKSSVCASSRPSTPSDFSGFYVISSQLRRAQHSAEILCGCPPTDIHPELREMDIPRYPLPLTLRAWHWVYLNRLIWLLGAKGYGETFNQAKTRIEAHLPVLEQLAQEHSKLVVVAHALTNRYLTKLLTQHGWHCVRKNYNYWGETELIRTG